MTKTILFITFFTFWINFLFINSSSVIFAESNENNTTIATEESNLKAQGKTTSETNTTKDTSNSGSSSTSDTQNITSTENPTRIDVKITNIIAKINPQTEITLPTGSFSEHFKHQFNNLNIIFDFNYNFLANELSGNITFEYPLRYILPYLSFSDSVDFESYVQPSIVDNEIQLAPTDKYLTRNRKIEGGVKYQITKDFNTFSSLNFNDLFKGDLSTATIIENGLDITTKIGTEYNTMKVVLPKSTLLFKGIYYKTSFNFKFRNDFSYPVSLDHIENFLLTAKTGKNWHIDQAINMGFPIKVWEGTLASFYTLGGFESVRGYHVKSINAFRYISSSTTIHRRITLKKEIKKKIFKNYYITSNTFDIYLFYDQCIAQNNLQLKSRVDYFPSIGFGSSVIISGENKRHLKLSLFLSQALKKGEKPIIYFKSSFFQFEK